MRDYLGREISTGDYLVVGGRGNSKSEYGSIMLYVEALTTGGIKVRRLHPAGYPEIKSRAYTLKRGQKVTIVSPSPEVADIFHRGIEGNVTREEKVWISNWVHGSAEFSDEGIPKIEMSNESS